MKYRLRTFLFSIILTHSFGLLAQAPLYSRAPEGFDEKKENIKSGSVHSFRYQSKTVGVEREAMIYLPPGYNNSHEYPVLYLLHGIGGDQRAWLNNGNVNIILDNLYENDRLTPMIVVMPNGRAMEDDRAGGNVFESEKVLAFSIFEDDLLHDLIPAVEKKYPVAPGSENRALAGLSMGGGQALNFGLKYFKQFSWIGGFSSAPNLKPPSELIPDAVELMNYASLIWLSCGDKDPLVQFTTSMHQYLEKNDVPHIYYIEEGGHDFDVWKNDIYHFSTLLFKNESN